MKQVFSNSTDSVLSRDGMGQIFPTQPDPPDAGLTQPAMGPLAIHKARSQKYVVFTFSLTLSAFVHVWHRLTSRSPPCGRPHFRSSNPKTIFRQIKPGTISSGFHQGLAATADNMGYNCVQSYSSDRTRCSATRSLG